MKVISCDSQYCEYDEFSARCGNFERFFIPFDYCVIGIADSWPWVGDTMEVSWFTNGNIHSRKYLIYRVVSVSVEKIVVISPRKGVKMVFTSDTKD